MRSASSCDGRLALVASDSGAAEFAPTSLAEQSAGTAGDPSPVAKLHAAETLADARALQAGLGDGESVITRAGERLGDGWVRVLRSGAAKQGALLREKRDPVAARRDRRSRSARARARSRRSPRCATSCWPREQQREDAQRALYLAHRGVSELAGQLQSQQRSAGFRARPHRTHRAELAQLEATLEGGREQVREARQRVEATRSPAWANWKPRGRCWTANAATSPRPAMPPAMPRANRAMPRMHWR